MQAEADILHIPSSPVHTSPLISLISERPPPLPLPASLLPESSLVDEDSRKRKTLKEQQSEKQRQEARANQLFKRPRLVVIGIVEKETVMPQLPSLGVEVEAAVISQQSSLDVENIVIDEELSQDPLASQLLPSPLSKEEKL